MCTTIWCNTFSLCGKWKCAFNVFEELRVVNEWRKAKTNTTTKNRSEKKHKIRREQTTISIHQAGIQWLPYTSAHLIFNIQPNDLVKIKIKPTNKRKMGKIEHETETTSKSKLHSEYGKP